MCCKQERTKKEFAKQVIWTVGVILATRLVLVVLSTTCSDKE